jgi:uncharacterized protein (TIGR02246 family)
LSNATAEQEVRKVYDRYVDAITVQDVDAMMDLYADDTHVFDTMSDWQYRGADAWLTNVKHWFGHESMSQGVVIDNLAITVSGDLAVARIDVHFSASTETETHGMWNRMTSALRKTDGSWTIFQEHTSTPINPETMQPIMERPSSV